MMLFIRNLKFSPDNLVLTRILKRLDIYSSEELLKKFLKSNSVFTLN